MIRKKKYIGHRFPLKYRLQGTCYYSDKCPVESSRIEKRRSLMMMLIGKGNDRYMRSRAK